MLVGEGGGVLLVSGDVGVVLVVLGSVERVEYQLYESYRNSGTVHVIIQCLECGYAKWQAHSDTTFCYMQKNKKNKNNNKILKKNV